MLVPITSIADLGLAIRATRHTQNLRLDDVAGAAGVSHVVAIDVEHGSDRGLGRATVDREMKRMLTRIVAAVASIMSEIETENAQMAKTALPAFAAEGRLLRVIQHIIVPDMVHRISSP